MRSSTSSARKASKSTKWGCSTPLAKRTREAGKALAGVCVVDLLRVGVGAARRRVVRPRGVRRGRRRPGRAGRGLGARRAPRAGRAVRLCPHCSSRRAHCRTHGRAASWLRVLPAPPAAPAVAGVPRHRDVPAQPRTAAAVKHLRGRAVPSRALASPSRGADRPVILGGAANSGHSRRTPSASGCGRAASGARTYRFGLNLSAAPPPSRRGDCARVEASERRFLDDQRGPEHRSCYTAPGSTGLVVGSVDHVAQTVVCGTPAT
jgi:hypothetical protein